MVEQDRIWFIICPWHVKIKIYIRSRLMPFTFWKAPPNRSLIDENCNLLFLEDRLPKGDPTRTVFNSHMRGHTLTLDFGCMVLQGKQWQLFE